MPLMFLDSPQLASAGGVRHAFFTRHGGVSDGLFTSLNCGFKSGDDPEKVAANRARAAAAMGVGETALVTARQVHSARVATVERPWRPAEAPEVDAMVTRAPGIALGVLTADCGPVLFADAEAGVVGAAHAGWKGALGGVLEATLAAMEALGARRFRIAVVLGPCIGADSYEVGPEFRDRFVVADAANARFFAPNGGDKSRFDLPGYVCNRLATAGVESAAMLDCDTCRDSERFFSYRRSVLAREPKFGLGLSAICLEPAR